MNQRNILLTIGTILLLFVLIFALFIVIDTDGGVNDLVLTNVTDSSATIVWDTLNPTVSEVMVSTEPLSQFKFRNDEAVTFFDDRDTNELKTPRLNHHVTLTGLDSGERYYFRINGSFFSFIQDIERFTTFTEDIEPSTPEVAYGSVINYESSGENPSDGLLVFRITNGDGNQSELLSTYLDENGDYTLDLTGIYSEQGDQYFFEPEESTLSINAVTNVGYGDARLSLEQTKPLPNVVVNIRYISPQFLE